MGIRKNSLFWLFLPQTVFAGCLNENTESRLANFCLVNSLNGKTIDLSTASIIDFNLKREGYAAGLGLPNRVERTSIQAYVTPTIDYNSNINGGNPNRPLVLGGLTFTGDEEFLMTRRHCCGLGCWRQRTQHLWRRQILGL